MPWREKTVEKIRLEFIQNALSGECSFSALCREYNISRVTGYKWLERYEHGEGLSDQSRRPFHTPNKTDSITEEIILHTRDQHPAWGPRKLRRYLENQGIRGLPAPSTIENILKRNHRIDKGESLAHVPYKRFERDQPNELWQADFKGDFLLEDRTRCFPLTVLDDHSRFSLCIDAKSNIKKEGVFQSFHRLFEEYGLPDAIITDNGNPWGNSQRTGYTLFDVWLMKLDILPIHGRPMHPQTQGKEERFHRTLKAELLKVTPLFNYAHAQERFDAYRKEYNHLRPHHALCLDVPAKHYSPSKRRYSPPKSPIYPEEAGLRLINKAGYFTYDRHTYFLSEALAGETIQVIPLIEQESLNIHFGHYLIARIDTNEHLFTSKKVFRCDHKL